MTTEQEVWVRVYAAAIINSGAHSAKRDANEALGNFREKFPAAPTPVVGGSQGVPVEIRARLESLRAALNYLLDGDPAFFPSPTNLVGCDAIKNFLG